MQLLSRSTFDALAHGARQRAAARVVALAEQEQPAVLAHLTAAMRLERAAQGIERALALGVPRGHAATALFALLRLTAGPRFDEHPACRRILGQRDMPPEARVFALIDPAEAVPWREIAAASVPR